MKALPMLYTAHIFRRHSPPFLWTFSLHGDGELISPDCGAWGTLESALEGAVVLTPFLIQHRVESASGLRVAFLLRRKERLDANLMELCR